MMVQFMSHKSSLKTTYRSLGLRTLGTVKFLTAWSQYVIVSSYAPNFEEVEEAYWFGPVRLSVTLALGQEPLEIGS